MRSELLANFLDCTAEIPLDISQKIASGTELVTAPVVESAVDQLAVRLTVDLQDQNPVFLTVLHGGLVFAGMILRRIVFPCEIGYVHTTRYGSATTGAELDWRAQDFPDLTGRQVVILDDILDEGKTMAALVQFCVEQGADTVRSAVLVERADVERSVGCDYAALSLGPGFLIGCGMDIAGYGRNLPGIYKLAD
ncbi:MAG: hypoxanthine-guanine phosphoribosyltransferase [Pseudomonadales bacterium]|nr:hypoxanthine-guanine phosphoribosyltransferase [Pseudomonadales bacterium]